VEGCVVEAVLGCAAAGAEGRGRGRAAENGQQLSSITFLSPFLSFTLTARMRSLSEQNVRVSGDHLADFSKKKSLAVLVFDISGNWYSIFSHFSGKLANLELRNFFSLSVNDNLGSHSCHWITDF
jgi:hypothetical protein